MKPSELWRPSESPARKQVRIEGAKAAFTVIKAAFAEYLSARENSDAFTPKQKKAVISGISCVLASVIRNYVKLEQELAADDEGIAVRGRSIVPTKFTAADMARYADIYEALVRLRTEPSVPNFRQIVQREREFLFTILQRSDSTVTEEEIADLDVEMLADSIGTIARTSLLHLGTAYAAWPKPEPTGPVN